MTRALAVCTVLLATASSASAGVYGSLGIGSTGISDSKGSLLPAGRSGRIAGGMRFQYLSVEAGLMGFATGRLKDVPYDGRELYAAGLGHYPLGNGFEVFGRLGLQHSSLDRSTSNSANSAGNGYLLGAGFEYVVKIPALARASVWVDYNRSNTTVALDTSPTTKRDLGVDMWSLGVTVGF